MSIWKIWNKNLSHDSSVLKRVYYINLSPFSSHINKMICTNPLVAVTQMTSTNDREKNFLIVKELTKKAIASGAQMVFFPEGCDYIAESKKESLDLSEELNGPGMSNYSELAKSCNVWLSLGGLHMKEEKESKISNTHIMIDNTGKIVEKYSKIHLFDVKIPERKIDLQESKYVERGKFIPNPVSTPCGQVALGICYDMRFPEFSLSQRKLGAQVLTFPSAFTVPTGTAHWHTLLRARAIESQCYIIAATQIGQHNLKRSSYGHALIVDPWGTVVAEINEGTDIALAEIDLNVLDKVRREMPVFSHRRYDLYSLCLLSSSAEEPRLTEVMPFPKDFVLYPFGHVLVPGSCVFLQTSLSHAVVNKKPFAPGHVLIFPQEPIERFPDLSAKEICDFAQTVVLAMQIIIEIYNPKSVQFVIQDGKHAGQTIKHVHAHVVPVTGPNDRLIEQHEAEDTKRCWREVEEMAVESAELRQYTSSVLRKVEWLSSLNIPRQTNVKDTGNLDKFKVNNLHISSDHVFNSDGCFAFIPGNGILPGHICICLCDVNTSSLHLLPPSEVLGLFMAVQRIQVAIEGYYSLSSTTIYVNNDWTKDQALIIHIIPRYENDLKETDDIYIKLYQYEPTPPDNSDEKLLNHLKNVFN